jgi:hypothetical protein
MVVTPDSPIWDGAPGKCLSMISARFGRFPAFHLDRPSTDITIRKMYEILFREEGR